MSAWQHFAIPAVLEISFLSVALYCVYRAQKNRIYPALWQLLIFLVASTILLFAAESVGLLNVISGVHAYEIYFYTYWASFLIEAVLILRVLHEMFRHAVRSIPGVQKLGQPIFFWAIVASVILACASGVTPHASGMSLLLASAQVLMRAQSVLALCMVAFLAIASHTLGVPFRSRIFGVAFGFGIMGLNNLVGSAFVGHNANLASLMEISHEAVYLAAIALWSVYFLLPEPQRRLVTVPVSSPLMRWNEVAQRLGNPAGQVAISYPPSFMTDVFELVENVMGTSSAQSGPRQAWPRQSSASPEPDAG